MKDSIINILASGLESLAINAFRKSCPNYSNGKCYEECPYANDLCDDDCVYLTRFRLNFKEALSERGLKERMNIEQKRQQLIHRIQEIPISKSDHPLSRHEVYTQMMDAAFKRAFATPQSAKEFLQRAGIYDSEGNLAEGYR